MGGECWLLCLVCLPGSRDGCVALPRSAMGCLSFVIVVFPVHTHFLFLISISCDSSAGILYSTICI